MAVEKRRIPKKDKAKRSLYMSAQTIKNLPKRKRIEWEGDKTPSGSGESYTYAQGGNAVMGKKKKAIRTRYGDDVDVDIDKHMSFPDKKGGSKTYRRKVKGKYRSLPGNEDTKSTVESTYTKQTRGGKVLKKEHIPETEKSMKEIMKDVQEEVVRPKKKKAVKKKEPVIGMVAPKKYRKLYKEKAKKWKEDKAKKAIKGEAKGKAFNTQERAKRETDARVQKQIKSNLGDWASSDDFKKKMKSGSDAFKKKMKSGSASFKSKMKSGSDAFRAKMKADSDAFKKKMGG